MLRGRYPRLPGARYSGCRPHDLDHISDACPLLAHSDAFATQFTSASDPSGHTFRRRSVAVECNGANPAPGGVALYLAAKRPLDRARKRSRPIRVTIAPPRTPAVYATPASITRTIRTGAVVPPACCSMAAASTYTGRAPAARTKILHTRGSLAPRWMGLISRTADNANPASSVTHPSRHWPGSVGQTHSPDQVVMTAPVGTLPVSTYRHRAITSLRASAMIMMRRTRPLRSPTRL